MSIATDQAQARARLGFMMRTPLAVLQSLRKPAFVTMCALALLAWFGFSRDFAPAPAAVQPVALAFYLLLGACLAAWVLHSFGQSPLGWKGALLACVQAIVIWLALAKGAAWVWTNSTGTPYDEAFTMQRSIKHVTSANKNYYSSANYTRMAGQSCLYRLQGEVLGNSLPNYLCIKAKEYAQIGEGPHDVHLQGRVSAWGRSIEGYAFNPSMPSHAHP
jgi:hypothetical protein